MSDNVEIHRKSQKFHCAANKHHGCSDSVVAIGNPERHMRKASHCGSKQQ